MVVNEPNAQKLVFFNQINICKQMTCAFFGIFFKLMLDRHYM